jgi:release factor glutamine methyltransferase
MPSIATLIHDITDALNMSSATPRLDAECLIAAVIQQPREYLFAYPEQTLSEQALQTLQSLTTRRQQGEPVAYLLEKKEFWSLMLKVTPDTLIPRPETEDLVEWLLTALPADSPLTIADLGTGCGTIAVALAHERPHWTLHATDYNFASLKVANHNAAQQQLNNIHFYQGNWCQALPIKQYDAIISNPPYIATDDAHLRQLKYEPQRALCSGTEGLDALKTIIHETQHYLKEGGLLAFEHGYQQAAAIKTLLDQQPYHDIAQHQDLNQQPRFTSCRLNSKDHLH